MKTKIVTLSRLIAICNKIRSKNKTVLATGVFDVLHSEHKKFLQAAKEKGTALFVGLESDARVRKLKGVDRPINSIEVRLNNIAHWGIADYVFPLPKKFSQLNDYQTLIDKIKPDILAISFHSPHQSVKERILGKCGGKVEIVLPYNPEISTTFLLDNR